MQIKKFRLYSKPYETTLLTTQTEKRIGSILKLVKDVSRCGTIEYNANVSKATVESHSYKKVLLQAECESAASLTFLGYK